MFRERILELNASDVRGILVVREKVKSFAQLTAKGESNKDYTLVYHEGYSQLKGLMVSPVLLIRSSSWMRLTP